MDHNNEQILAKVQLLIEQNRYNDAEEMLASVLRTDPSNYIAYYYMTIVKIEQDKYAEARQLIDTALGIAPEESMLYHTKARIEMHDKQYDKAEVLLHDALQMQPEDDNCYALWAFIKLERKQYDEALDLANSALELNGENILALNTRSTALIKLDRKDDAYQTIEGALNQDPNNSYTHANYGWSLLEKGEHQKSLEHFREALTNNPNSQYAKSGMAEAIKASNPVYRMYLKYSFWMSNLSSQYQWAVILGFYFGQRILRAIGTAVPALKPILFPLAILLAIVALSTWLIRPVGNVLLRFNKYGQYMLSKREKLSSNFVAASLAVAVLSLIGFFVLGNELLLMIAAFGLIMSIPFACMFYISRPKHALLIYAAVMFLLGIAAIGTAISTGIVFNGFTSVVLIGFIVYQFAFNFLSIREDNL